VTIICTGTGELSSPSQSQEGQEAGLGTGEGARDGEVRKRRPATGKHATAADAGDAGWGGQTGWRGAPVCRIRIASQLECPSAEAMRCDSPAAAAGVNRDRELAVKRKSGSAFWGLITAGIRLTLTRRCRCLPSAVVPGR
jgi:hypothetical protein